MHSTFWLRFIRVVLGVMLYLDVAALVITLLNPVQTFGTVQSSEIFAGDPYVHRMHQELSTRDVFVFPVGGTTQAQWVLFVVSHGVAFCLAVIPMLILARRLIAGVLAEEPFTLRTVRRLRVLGAVVLAGGAVSELTEYVTARVLLDSVVSAEMRIWSRADFHLTLWWLIPGLILLAFAEVVRRGRTLRDELDTII